MKGRIILTLSLTLSLVVVSLMGPDSTTHAQRNSLNRYDSGIVTFGSGQKFVVTVAIDGDLDADIVFHEYGHGLTSCAGTICKSSVTSESTTNPIHLAIGEGASDTVAFSAGSAGTRIVVLSRSQMLVVNALVIDTATGAITSSNRLISGG